MSQDTNTFGNVGPNQQSRPGPARPIMIQPGQANQLVQALKNEISMAKAAGGDASKAQHHYAKAESIKQILLNYQAQQKARIAQQQQQQQQRAPSNPVSQPTERSGSAEADMDPNQIQRPNSQLSSSNFNVPQASYQPSPVKSASPMPGAATANNVVTLDKFNKLKSSLGELERKIQQLQGTMGSLNLSGEQASSVENQLNELKNKYAQYQKYAIFMKNQLLEQAKNSGGSISSPLNQVRSAQQSVC